ncbi:MAG: hypothetical protein JO235_21660 [Chroococcidiopsidaceae cyanobacterium CP_BM_RX_35]|nr:hypothetical protein [Chroococcidiopsidaceae cyanobacterium CP_BM_RX_35]
MNRQRNRPLLIIAVCSLLGVVVGGTVSRAESIQCLNAKLPTTDCLNQDSLLKTIEGMSSGLIAGAGAAIGATWNLWKQD